MHWRLISDDEVTASFGLAADEYISRRVSSGGSMPALRLYTYKSHCALVGRHQSVDNEINREYCQAHDIAINRRPTGGGAIVMGQDQLGIALSIATDPGNAEPHFVREYFSRFSHGIVSGLELVGIRAAFAGKNDVEVRHKKIAGLGIFHNGKGGLLFHASLLVDLDIGLMLKILRTPFEGTLDKAITIVGKRITTVRRECASDCSLETVRGSISNGLASEFGIDLIRSEFDREERTEINRLERVKYQSREWIDQKTALAGASGRARVKTRGGLLDIQLTLAGNVIKAIYITGSFFAEDASVNALERRLRWSAADESSIAAKVTGFLDDRPHAFEGMSGEDISSTIVQAVKDARIKELSPDPYGCFVNPVLS